MTRNAAETLIGALVLIVAVAFFAFAYSRASIQTVAGYKVTARFANIGTLTEGADVRLSGIKIGSVLKQDLDPEFFEAVVTMSVDPSVQLPDDTAAQVASDGLLGGAYIKLLPGGSEQVIAPGGQIQFTESAVDVVDLAKQLVFSPSQTPAESE